MQLRRMDVCKALMAMCGLALSIGCYGTPEARIVRPDLPALFSSESPLGVGETVVESLARGTGSEALTAQATLEPMNESRVKAKIEFVDDGSTLFVRGAATGLDPTQTYLTLIYDNGSVAKGPTACTPTIFDPENPEFLLDRMIVGAWRVDARGIGRLSAINTNFGADYVPVGLFANASVRRVLGSRPAPGAPPPTELVACGEVVIQDDRAAGDGE